VNSGKGMAETALIQGKPWGFDMRDVGQKVIWHHSLGDEEVGVACAEMTWRHLPNVAVRTYEGESHSSPNMFSDLLDALRTECTGNPARAG
jgi:hypothetical protein